MGCLNCPGVRNSGMELIRRLTNLLRSTDWREEKRDGEWGYVRRLPNGELQTKPMSDVEAAEWQDRENW